MTYNTDFEFIEHPTFSLARLAWKAGTADVGSSQVFFCSSEANVWSWWLTEFSLAGLLTAEVFFYSGNTRGTASEPYLPKPLKPPQKNTHIPNLATSKIHSALWPCHHKSMKGNVRWLVSYHLEKILHCCRSTLMVFSDAFSRYHLTYHACFLQVFKIAAMFITEQDQVRHLS